MSALLIKKKKKKDKKPNGSAVKKLQLQILMSVGNSQRSEQVFDWKSRGGNDMWNAKGELLQRAGWGRGGVPAELKSTVSSSRTGGRLDLCTRKVTFNIPTCAACAWYCTRNDNQHAQVLVLGRQDSFFAPVPALHCTVWRPFSTWGIWVLHYKVFFKLGRSSPVMTAMLIPTRTWSWLYLDFALDQENWRTRADL